MVCFVDFHYFSPMLRLMNAFKVTIKFALLGTILAAFSALSSCSCGGDPAPIKEPDYVAPPTK